MARQSSKSVDVQDTGEAQRLDKWLWFARVAKTRTLATSLVSNGRVRVNRVRTTKPAQTVRVGDVITVSAIGGVRVLKILGGGTRRGTAPEAALLYEEIVPLQSARQAASSLDPRSQSSGTDGPAAPAANNETSQGRPVIEAGSGRPTKKDRRILDRLRSLREE